MIESVQARAFTVPTDAPEADGTLAWDSTTVVVVEAAGDGATGIGFSYADAAAAKIIQAKLAPAVCGVPVGDVARAWQAMVRTVRNLGRPGVASAAISAVDIALWDLKAKTLGVPLAVLLGRCRDHVPVYGSGGFTSYDDARLAEQLGGWAAEGMRWVKMKVGSDPARDAERVSAARAAIGPDVGLMVDANGAYSAQQALARAEEFAAENVVWFEEPVSSDDLPGLARMRARAPAGMEVAAGEYGYDPHYFRRMLAAGAVDVLQVDATRCGGITGFMQAAVLAQAFHCPLSAHTAPSIHLHPCCAVAGEVRHVEFFHDHARIEAMLFDGAAAPENGVIQPDLSRPGLGLALRQSDAVGYAA